MTEVSDPLWYYELQVADGWHARTSAYEARNVEAKNGRRAIRNATKVAEEHKGRTLRQLRDIYGSDEIAPAVVLPATQWGSPEVIPVPTPPTPTVMPSEYIEWLEFHKQTLTDIEEQIAVDDLIVGIRWLSFMLARAIDPNIT